MSQKFENLLNLSLETPQQERIKSGNLNVGYEAATDTWELVVKYNGSLEFLSDMGILVEELIAGYAILTVPAPMVETIAGFPEIEYVEQPKQYYFEQVTPGNGPCVTPVTLGKPGLLGTGVLLAVLDSGIDYRLPVFRSVEGLTRIEAFWDQTATLSDRLRNQGLSSPLGFTKGVEYKRQWIDDTLASPTKEEQFMRMPSVDVSGHGTAVAGIAGGSFVGDYVGIAPDCDFLVVKLQTGADSKTISENIALTNPGYVQTTSIMRGVTYVIRKALTENKPLVINLSFGNSYGDHDGSSLLERFLDNASEIGKTVICVGMGNEGAAGGHFEGRFAREELGGAASEQSVELAVASTERSLNLQLWKDYADLFEIFLISPAGEEVKLNEGNSPGKYTYVAENTRLLVYYGEPLPYSVHQEIYVEMIPDEGDYIDGGIWSIVLIPGRIVNGSFSLYLPSRSTQNVQTGFFRASPWRTFTIPATSGKVISVGAYNSLFDSYADFSGRGNREPAGLDESVFSPEKPDLVAPGVNILAPGESFPLPGDNTVATGQYVSLVSVTGTSFATPFVSGACALLMEWGIVRGNDPYLYGEKLKAYLRRGAKRIRGEAFYPNGKVGYGALCISDSLPDAAT